MRTILTPEYEEGLRQKINPVYADTIGTESYVLKVLFGEIDYLRSVAQSLGYDMLEKEQLQNAKLLIDR